MNDEVLLEIGRATYSIMIKHNIISETQIRNDIIIAEFRSLKCKGMSSKKAREILCNKYFISYANMLKIIYPKKVIDNNG